MRHTCAIVSLSALKITSVTLECQTLDWQIEVTSIKGVIQQVHVYIKVGYNK